MAGKKFKGKGREIFVEDYDHAVLEYEAGRRRKEDRELNQGFSSREELLIIHTEPLFSPSPAPAPQPSPPVIQKADRSSSSSFSHRFKKFISSQKKSSQSKETIKPGRGIWKMYQAWDIEQAEQRKSRRHGISGFSEGDLKQLELDFADPPTPPSKRQGTVIEQLDEIKEAFKKYAQESKAPKSGSTQEDVIDDLIDEILEFYLQEEPLAKITEDPSEEAPDSPIDPFFQTL